METRTANILTSIAMFYDLEDPIAFARQIEEVLDDNGVWHFEQSYMPSMLRTNSYDTICHEHLEVYSQGGVKRVVSEANLAGRTNSASGYVTWLSIWHDSSANLRLSYDTKA